MDRVIGLSPVIMDESECIYLSMLAFCQLFSSSSSSPLFAAGQVKFCYPLCLFFFLSLFFPPFGSVGQLFPLFTPFFPPCLVKSKGFSIPYVIFCQLLLPLVFLASQVQKRYFSCSFPAPPKHFSLSPFLLFTLRKQVIFIFCLIIFVRICIYRRVEG